MTAREDKEVWASIDPGVRLGLVNGRISNLENQLYNLRLSELERVAVNEDERTRLIEGLKALQEERDSVQAELDKSKPAAPGA